MKGPAPVFMIFSRSQQSMQDVSGYTTHRSNVADYCCVSYGQTAFTVHNRYPREILQSGPNEFGISWDWWRIYGTFVIGIRL